MSALLALSGCAYHRMNVDFDRQPLRKSVDSGFIMQVSGLDWIRFRDPTGRLTDMCPEWEFWGLGFNQQACDMKRTVTETNLLLNLWRRVGRLGDSITNLFASEKKVVPKGFTVMIAAPPGRYLVHSFGYTKVTDRGNNSSETTTVTWTYKSDGEMPVVEVKRHAVTLVGYLDVAGREPRWDTSPAQRREILDVLKYELKEAQSDEERLLRQNWLPAVEKAVTAL